MGTSPQQHILVESSTLWLSHHAQLGIYAKTQFNKRSSKGSPNHTLHAHSFVFARLYPGIHFLCYLADWVDCSRQSFFILLLKKRVLVKSWVAKVILSANPLECRELIRLILIDNSVGNLQDTGLNHFPLQLHWKVTKAISSGRAETILQNNYNTVHMTLEFKRLKSKVFIHVLYCCLLSD